MHPGLVEGAPAHGRGLELDDLQVLSSPNKSMIRKGDCTCSHLQKGFSTAIAFSLGQVSPRQKSKAGKSQALTSPATAQVGRLILESG